jgi:hypothetical protein
MITETLECFICIRNRKQIVEESRAVGTPGQMLRYKARTIARYDTGQPLKVMGIEGGSPS